MITIGITGTLGAGKGTVVEYLVRHYKFVHYSVRDFLTVELEKRNIPVDRDSMVALGNELRAQHHPGYVIEVLCLEAKKRGEHAVIESIRTPGEIDVLRTVCDGTLFAVDADPHLRFDRICARKSATDHVSFETFLSNEAREMTATDPNKQNIAECMRQADCVFFNNSTLEALHEQVDHAMK